MNKQTYKVATWNIAEGYPSDGDAQFSYAKHQDIEYFAKHIKALSPDIVCLQESQSKEQYSLSEEISKITGHSYIFHTPAHPSHVHQGYMSSSAILSRKPFLTTSANIQPYPTFDLKLPNGKPARQLDECLQIVSIDGLHIANIKTQPMEYLGHAYETKLGQEYANVLSEWLISSLQAPVILCGDFNTPDPSSIFSLLRTKLELRDTLPQVPTKPHYHGHLDCIFASPEFEVIESRVIPTESDHFLCYATLQISLAPQDKA